MDTALLKLKQLVSSRYGKGLELRKLMDLSKLKVDSEPIVQGHDFIIPIVVQEQFLGTAVITHGWELCEEKKKGITQLVRMILEPKLYGEYLERRENNLQTLESLTFSTQNIQLFGDDNSVYEDQGEDFAEAQHMITSLLHLQGKDVSLIKKISLQIHEFSARWAFVPFEDVCQELKCSMDISNLGGMTLFVQDIEKLSSEHQELLADYLKCPRSLAEPLILTSSSLTIHDLEKQITSAALFEDIQSSNLEVERTPLNSQTLREMLSLFFYQDDNQDLH